MTLVPLILSLFQSVPGGTGSVSSGNTTMAPLGGGAAFTGVWEDVTGYAVINVAVISDQDSATDGLAFQWSTTTAAADVTEASGCSANTGRAFAITPRARYFRVVYTNGATPQTVFRLQTVFKTTGTGLITRPLDKSLTDENFAQTVRATLNGRDGSGTYTHVAGAASSPAGSEYGLITRNIPSGTQTVGGGAAHAAPASGNPGQDSAYAEADAAALDSTNVVEGDVTRLKATIEGQLLVRTDHPFRVNCNMLSTATTLTEITGCAAPGAGISYYITDIQFSSSVAGGTAADSHFTVKYGTGANCGTGTTTVWRLLTPANTPGVASFQTPIKIPANNAVCFIFSGAGTRTVNVLGFKAP